MSRLEARVRRPAELDAAARDAMYSLFAQHYAATTRARFEADLAGKDYLIELHADGALRGFSTLALDDFVAGGRRRRAIFSGDTIIHRDSWGEQALVQAFCRLAGALHAADPATPLYWFLITKGHRTWRYLNAFAHRYHPHPLLAPDALATECIDLLARRRFGAAWQAAQGVVRFARPVGALRPELAAPRASLARRPEIRYFLERNPGHAQGDELCCLTELTPANLRGHARRAFLQGCHDDPRVVPTDRGERAPAAQRAGHDARAAAAPAGAHPG